MVVVHSVVERSPPLRAGWRRAVECGSARLQRRVRSKS
jgi:hypothetical protein